MSTPQSRTPAASAVVDKAAFRTKSLGTRVTPEELREIEAAAERDGKKLAEWMREAVLRSARPSLEAPTELLLEELSALRYMLLNLFEGTAQAARQNAILRTEDTQAILEAADRKKQARAKKLVEEFQARRAPGRSA